GVPRSPCKVTPVINARKNDGTATPSAAAAAGGARPLNQNNEMRRLGERRRTDQIAMDSSTVAQMASLAKPKATKKIAFKPKPRPANSLRIVVNLNWVRSFRKSARQPPGNKGLTDWYEQGPGQEGKGQQEDGVPHVSLVHLVIVALHAHRADLECPVVRRVGEEYGVHLSRLEDLLPGYAKPAVSKQHLLGDAGLQVQSFLLAEILVLQRFLVDQAPPEDAPDQADVGVDWFSISWHTGRPISGPRDTPMTAKHSREERSPSGPQKRITPNTAGMRQPSARPCSSRSTTITVIEAEMSAVICVTSGRNRLSPQVSATEQPSSRELSWCTIVGRVLPGHLAMRHRLEDAAAAATAAGTSCRCNRGVEVRLAVQVVHDGHHLGAHADHHGEAERTQQGDQVALAARPAAAEHRVSAVAAAADNTPVVAASAAIVSVSGAAGVAAVDLRIFAVEQKRSGGRDRSRHASLVAFRRSLPDPKSCIHNCSSRSEIRAAEREREGGGDRGSGDIWAAGRLISAPTPSLAVAQRLLDFRHFAPAVFGSACRIRPSDSASIAANKETAKQCKFQQLVIRLIRKPATSSSPSDEETEYTHEKFARIRGFWVQKGSRLEIHTTRSDIFSAGQQASASTAVCKVTAGQPSPQKQQQSGPQQQQQQQQQEFCIRRSSPTRMPKQRPSAVVINSRRPVECASSPVIMAVSAIQFNSLLLQDHRRHISRTASRTVSMIYCE
uniref:HTH La-type RNA-binding domain-containing protein n=1 Tax=Macrostomum lignano TaxID=282301 RepID=A0A1I8IMA6_9PLAT